MSTYFIADGTVQRGPFPIPELPAHGLRPDTLVWKEGMAQWQRADEVEELAMAGVLTSLPPPMPPGPVPYAGPYPAQAPVPYAGPMPYPGAARPYNPADSNRVAAGVCGILLGGLGVHKFILGMTGPGLIMLLVTVLTCGWGGIVMGTIGMIEGIIYLTKTDEQFYYEYVVRQRPWF